MKSRNLLTFMVICACLLSIYTGQVSAVVLEVTSLGTVSSLNETDNSMTITDPRIYGCEYFDDGSVNCSFGISEKTVLTGTIPDKKAFSIFKSGDQALVTGYGGADGSFITVAKVVPNESGFLFITDIIGDISSIPLPFIGEYEIYVSGIPDCTNCSGTLCTASATQITIRSETRDLEQKELLPGETLIYNGKNDGSQVNVTFVSGTAPSSQCEKGTIMTGPQPVSDFIVSIRPPIGEDDYQNTSLVLNAEKPE